MQKASWKRAPGSARASGKTEGLSQALPQPRALAGDFRTRRQHSSLSHLLQLSCLFPWLFPAAATFFSSGRSQQASATSVPAGEPRWWCPWARASLHGSPAASGCPLLQFPLLPVLFALRFIFTKDFVLVDTNSSLCFPRQNKGFTGWIKMNTWMHVHERQWAEKKASKKTRKARTRRYRSKKYPLNPFSDFTKLACRKTGDTEIIQPGKQ